MQLLSPFSPLKIVVFGALVFFVSACGDDTEPEIDPDAPLIRQIDDRGGTLEGAPGSVFDRVKLVVPPETFPTSARVKVEMAQHDAPLPEGAFAVGPQFRVEVSGPAPQRPLLFTIPFDETEVSQHNQDFTQVKVWIVGPDGWLLSEPVDATEKHVTIEMLEATIAGAGVKTR